MMTPFDDMLDGDEEAPETCHHGMPFGEGCEDCDEEADEDDLDEEDDDL